MAGRFADRTDAGKRLAELVLERRFERTTVLALPRGGVPVAREVARALHVPLEVLGVRKLGLPDRPELAFGAIGEGEVLVLPDVARFGLSDDQVERVVRTEGAELTRRVRHYRGGRPLPSLEGRLVLVVDDGLATGLTAIAAVEVARAHHADRVVVAVPVASPEAVRALRERADDVVCVQAPEKFLAVGHWYRDFSPTTDAEVVAALAGSRGEDHL